MIFALFQKFAIKFTFQAFWLISSISASTRTVHTYLLSCSSLKHLTEQLINIYCSFWFKKLNFVDTLITTYI